MAKQAIDYTLDRDERELPVLAVSGGNAPRVFRVSPYGGASLAQPPTRMCLGCRERAEQGSLIQIFSISLDQLKQNNYQPMPSKNDCKLQFGASSCSGRTWGVLRPSVTWRRPPWVTGRTAYVHDSIECTKRACLPQRLQRAFRENISEQRAQDLLKLIVVKGEGYDNGTSVTTRFDVSSQVKLRENAQIKREAMD